MGEIYLNVEDDNEKLLKNYRVMRERNKGIIEKINSKQSKAFERELMKGSLFCSLEGLGSEKMSVVVDKIVAMNECAGIVIKTDVPKQMVWKEIDINLNVEKRTEKSIDLLSIFSHFTKFTEITENQKAIVTQSELSTSINDVIGDRGDSQIKTTLSIEGVTYKVDALLLKEVLSVFEHNEDIQIIIPTEKAYPLLLKTKNITILIMGYIDVGTEIVDSQVLEIEAK